MNNISHYLHFSVIQSSLFRSLSLSLSLSFSLSLYHTHTRMDKQPVALNLSWQREAQTKSTKWLEKSIKKLVEENVESTLLPGKWFLQEKNIFLHFCFSTSFLFGSKSPFQAITTTRSQPIKRTWNGQQGPGDVEKSSNLQMVDGQWSTFRP